MKNLLLSFAFILVTTSLSFGQDHSINPSYRYVAGPGFVNVTELSGAVALRDTALGPYSDYYYGLTNIFGYQTNRNFFGGFGCGM